MLARLFEVYTQQRLCIPDFKLVTERLALLVMQPEGATERLFSDRDSPVRQLNGEGAARLDLFEGDGFADRSERVTGDQADGVVALDRDIARVAHRPDLGEVGIWEHTEVVGDRDMSYKGAVGARGLDVLLDTTVDILSHLGYDQLSERRRLSSRDGIIFVFLFLLRLGLDRLFMS